MALFVASVLRIARQYQFRSYEPTVQAVDSLLFCSITGQYRVILEVSRLVHRVAVELLED